MSRVAMAIIVNSLFVENLEGGLIIIATKEEQSMLQSMLHHLKSQ